MKDDKVLKDLQLRIEREKKVLNWLLNKEPLKMYKLILNTF